VYIQNVYTNYIKRGLNVNGEKKRLEYRQLTGFLLLLALEVKTENGFIHDASHQEDLLDFFFLGNTAELVVEGDRDLGFEELLFLFCRCHR
jgi:hypothetical protein